MASKKVMVSICGDDRISSLPDGVLCHILSFLPTKYSVRTSLLSTRWKHLFTFVPSLDFKYSALITAPRGSNASNSISFIRFVSSVIMSYNVSCMNKFCFQFFDLEHAPSHFPIFSYISAVIRRHVQEIDISVTSSPRLTLPLDLFSSKTITKLMLQGRFNFVLPRSVSLTCLRTCILLNVRFDDESARRLFRSCPVLINLDLINCFVGDVVALDISVPTLEHLTFYESGEIDRLVLNVPKLLHFDYAGPTSVEFSGLESLKSLVDANIFSEPDSSTRHSNIVDLVRSVSHVQQLYLNCDVMEAFLCSGHSLPTFNNVTRIRFGYISCFSLRFLPGLLNSTPRVEFLTLEGSGDEENSTNENGHLSPLHVPACVSRCLKEVDFRFFGGLDYEFKLINYFLKYANNLKVMKMQTENVHWRSFADSCTMKCPLCNNAVQFNRNLSANKSTLYEIYRNNCSPKNTNDVKVQNLFYVCLKHLRESDIKNSQWLMFHVQQKYTYLKKLKCWQTKNILVQEYYLQGCLSIVSPFVEFTESEYIDRYCIVLL